MCVFPILQTTRIFRNSVAYKRANGEFVCLAAVIYMLLSNIYNTCETTTVTNTIQSILEEIM